MVDPLAPPHHLFLHHREMRARASEGSEPEFEEDLGDLLYVPPGFLLSHGRGLPFGRREAGLGSLNLSPFRLYLPLYSPR